VIDDELERQLSGGCAEASCIAELGGALGAQYIITGNLDRLGSLYILSLKLIDIEQVSAVKTAAIQEASLEGFARRLSDEITELLR
jgi:TolB-like protein